MARLTITLPDERYCALRATAARLGKTIGAMIDECLAQAGIKTVAQAADLVARARQRSTLGEAAATTLAVRETRADRRRRRRRRPPSSTRTSSSVASGGSTLSRKPMSTSSSPTWR